MPKVPAKLDPKGPTQVQPPKLVNRGPTGLLTKLDHKATTEVVQTAEGKIDDIRCVGEVVEIDSLTQDPDNARVHPERNMAAIRDSLKEYGQTVPLVVRRETRVIVAGNGRHQAAKELGWTKIAVSFTDMSEIEATGYGMADNRTAELAKWNFEVVARLDKLLLEAKHATIGWSADELEVLRAADWTPPPIKEGFGEADENAPLLLSFTPDQYQVVGAAIDLVKQMLENPNMGQAEALTIICRDWLPKEETVDAQPVD